MSATATLSPPGSTAPGFQPEPPRRIDQIDIPEHLLTDIAVRLVYLRGTSSIQQLAESMKLSLELAEALFRRLSDQQYFEVRRMAGDDYVFSLTVSGRRLAVERAVSMRYAGPVPVSLAAYAESVRAQKGRIDVNREKLRRAFSDIILTDDVLDALGPALISRTAIFLYGQSGTGKTTISERLNRVFEDLILVPYAVELDGQIISVADPAIHEPAAPAVLKALGLDLDPRWVICRRPCLTVGGELVTSMLDLQRDDASGTYSAPLQMKANNGILLIDDFGRQMMSPRDLLNRWIVPLDRRIDFLSLSSGRKFDIPFELLIIFSTNLEPKELADDAFLRRIPNKILIHPVDAATFDAIFDMTMAAAGMECEPGSAAYCRELCLRNGPDLRPCFPRDLCNAMRSIAIYEGRPPSVTRDDLERAITGYFV